MVCIYRYNVNMMECEGSPPIILLIYDLSSRNDKVHRGNGCIAIEWSRPRTLDLGPYADGSTEKYMLTAQIDCCIAGWTKTQRNLYQLCSFQQFVTYPH